MKKLREKIKEAELIVFDFDGSIVDSLDVFLESFQKALLAYNRKCSIAEVKNNLGACSFVEIRKNLAPKSYRVIRKMLGEMPGKKIAEAHEYFQRNILKRTAEIKAFDDAAEAVKKLSKTKKLALLTNSSKKYTERILKRLKIKNCFKKLVYGDSGFRDKAAGLRYLIKSFRAAPEKTICIGDAPSDIRAAKKAKCIPAAVIRWYSSEELMKEKPVCIVKSLRELY